MITRPVYTTREAVKRALDYKPSASNDEIIDDAIEGAARDIDGELKRRFYPEIKTLKFDWPNHSSAPAWELWLDSNEIISATSVTAGGTLLSANDYVLRRGDDKNEPPYDRIEILLSSNSAFHAGSTFQQSLAINGLWAACADDSAPAGTAAQALADTTGTVLNVSNSTAIGVGDIIRADNERFIVADKAMLDTGQNLAGNITAMQNVEIVGVQSGAVFTRGEVIMIDAELMRIREIAGNNLIVKRAYDGSTLAAHNAPADVYAPRTLSIVRGALGTTAATHNNAVALTRFRPPALISEYCKMLTLANERLKLSGMVPDTFENKGLKDMQERVMTAYGRNYRMDAV